MSTPLPAEFKIIDIICDLLRNQLALTEEQVWIYNQKRDIPNTPGLFIEVGLVATKPFATASHCADDEAGNFCEFQSLNVQETYYIHLFSRDESAFSRAWEVSLALSGVISQQAQETYGFRFGQIPTSFLDASFLEASARLFRQDLTFNALRSYSKTRVIQYFDQFNIPPIIHPNQ